MCTLRQRVRISRHNRLSSHILLRQHQDHRHPSFPIKPLQPFRSISLIQIRDFIFLPFRYAVEARFQSRPSCPNCIFHSPNYFPTPMNPTELSLPQLCRKKQCVSPSAHRPASCQTAESQINHFRPNIPSRCNLLGCCKRLCYSLWFFLLPTHTATSFPRACP